MLLRPYSTLDRMQGFSITRSLLAGTILLLGSQAIAETGWVTDVLSLGLHRAEDTSDRAFRTLKSGDEVEILSRDGYYARVRMPDGTEGYVKVAYIVTDKPARAVVAETAAERDRLSAELEDLKAAFADPAERLEQLEGELAAARNALDEATTEVNVLEEQNSRLVARDEQYRFSLPYAWVAGAALICLIAGILLGLWWNDYQSRRRHGGIRVL